ncbi:MAG: Ig-like domain-containing protein, partial [Propionibacteriaceae bacterium]|nr:Ig-like domain-containing protein [Propionibacteriaceae bacterium]
MSKTNPTRWLALSVATLTMLSFVVAGAPITQAATGDQAHSSAQFISGTILGGVDTSAVAGLAGVKADYVEQSPAQPAVVNTGDLDATGALGLVNINLSGISLPFTDLVKGGLANQYAYAGPDGIAKAASGAVSSDGVVDVSGTSGFPADATFDLMKILPATPLLSTANLHLGAVTGVAALDGAQLANGTNLSTSCANLSDPTHCRGYAIGDATMTLTSPIFEPAVSTLNTAIGTVSDAINGIAGTIISTITSTLSTGLNVLGGSVNLSANLSVDLRQAVDSVLNQDMSSGGVTVNISKGTITIDMNTLLALNNLPPNTEVFSSQFATAVGNQINTIMSGFQNQINTIVQNALSSVRLTVSGGGCPVPQLPFLGCVSGTVGVSYDGSLQDFISGAQTLQVSGSGLASLGAAVINPAISLVQTGLSTVVQPVISGAIATAGATIGTLFSGMGAVLSPALALFGQVMNLTMNVQEENVDGQGTFTEVAARMTFLGGAGMKLDMGKAVVGPNRHNVDNTPPAAPVISAPVDGSSTNDTTPLVSGTGEPGATVHVSIDGTEVGTATVDTNGNWEYQVPDTAPLNPGAHTVTANQVDPAGNKSPDTTNNFIVDQAAPTPVVITTPINGTTIGQPTPTISGTGHPGDTVTISDGGQPVCTATVQADGTWTCQVSTPLADGPHVLVATQTTPAGTPEGPTDSAQVTVDTTALPPVITAPANGSSTKNTTPVITGVGEPGAKVQLSIDDGTPVEVLVDPNGNWSYTPSTPLGEGPHALRATQTDPTGNTSSPTTSTFTVDTTVPTAPVITTPPDESTTTDSTPDIKGTGTPGDEITVRDRRDLGDEPIGKTVVQPDGTWSLTPTTPLPEGPQEVVATATDPAGNTSPEANNDFTVDSKAPGAPTVTGPAPGAVTNDSTPEITGTGEPGNTVEVSVDGTPIGKATVRPDGTWSLTPTTPLAEGPHTVSATQSDPAGNKSPASTPTGFVVDTTAPSVPVISSPAPGSVTNDSTPTVTGRGEPGATV